jgi:hypothetical protein
MSEKHVIIQKRINEAIEKEMQSFFKDNEKDALISLIMSGKYENLSLKEIKEKVEGT